MFGLLGRKGRTAVGAVAGFGKIPALGDFVRTPEPSDEMIAFETWLTRAMEAGEARGAAFKDGFSNAGPHCFVWSGTIDKKTRGLLAGVVSPSQDAVGRRYPVVVCAPLPTASLATHPHAAPLVLHDFFHHAAEAAARASRMRTVAEFCAQVLSIAPPSFDSAAASLAKYSSWAKAQRASDVWSSLFGADPERAARFALYMLVEATAAYRGQDSPPLSLGVRVPLGSDPRTIAAMWIDLVRRAAGWKTTVPTVFYPLRAASPRALIQLGGEAPASVMSDLYAPTDSASVCELAVVAPRLPSQLPPAVGRATAAPDAAVSDVIHELGR